MNYISDITKSVQNNQISQNIMEKIISNPGLQHLAEKVFLNLDVEDLKICGQINQSCKQILENPMFWLKKFRNLSKENRKEWINVITSVKNSDKQNAIMTYLQLSLKKEALVDLPCYTNPAIQDKFKKRIRKSCEKWGRSSDEDLEIVKILAPLTDNPNAPNIDGKTPIYWAAKRGHIEIVKILAPLTENPNVPDKNGKTPFDIAKNEEIRTILESFKLSKKRTNAEPPKPQPTKHSRKQ